MHIYISPYIQGWATKTKTKTKTETKTKKTPEVSSGGPLSYRLPQLGEPICISVPAGGVRGCIQLQWIFWKIQHICLLHDGWLTSRPAHTPLSIKQFLTKNGNTSVPHPPYSPDFTPRFLSVSLDEKSSQRETFCRYESGETKKWQKH